MAEATRFQAGDRVTVRVDSPVHHFRTPTYIQGRSGRVAALCGIFPNPESLAHGGTGTPHKPLYRVEFLQTEVWNGYLGDSADKILVDIYEPWLEPASS